MRELNIKSISTCDDALLLNYLSSSNREALSNSRENHNPKTCLLHYHSWRLSESQRFKILSQYKKVSRYLLSQGFKVNILAMTPSDIDDASELREFLDFENCSIIEYTPFYNQLYRHFEESSLVVTMKHHPIVFAQSARKPVLALSTHNYSYNKNKGALKNTSMEEYNLTFDDFIDDDLLMKKIKELISQSQNIRQLCDKYNRSSYDNEKTLYNRIEEIIN